MPLLALQGTQQQQALVDQQQTSPQGKKEKGLNLQQTNQTPAHY